jgi:hypothetical protein
MRPNLVREIRGGKFEGLTDILFLQIQIVLKKFLTIGIRGHGGNNTADGEPHSPDTGLTISFVAGCA